MIFAARLSIGLLLASALLPGPVKAEELDFDRYAAYCVRSTAEQQLLSDLADAELDGSTLFDAALVVAGHRQLELVRYKAELAQSIDRCRKRLDPTDSGHDRLRAIFLHLTEEYLHGEYQPDLYDLGRTLSSGDFNCLTATILFHSLCKAFSTEIQTVWEPSHVQCWWPVTSTTGHLIETTSASAENAIGPLSSINQLTGRRISNSELIAKVFYNKGVCALKSENFATALAATWAGCLLDPKDEPAQSNLRACFNNWALDASEEDDLELAQELLEKGLELDPRYEPFFRNRAFLQNR